MEQQGVQVAVHHNGDHLSDLSGKRKFEDYQGYAQAQPSPTSGAHEASENGEGPQVALNPPGLHPLLANLGIGIGLPPGQNPYLPHQRQQPQQRSPRPRPQQQQAAAPEQRHSHGINVTSLSGFTSAPLDAQSPQPGKEKKPRKKRERKKSRKEKEDPRPRILFQGSRFELWLETRFEEELLQFFKVPSGQALQFSVTLAASSSTPPTTRSWLMARSNEERLYKDKWRKRYHVYSTPETADLVSDSFNFHIRIKNEQTGEYNKLPFVAPEQVLSSPLTSYSNYLSLLGGAHLNPSDDHCGYPPGESRGEDACTLYEGSDVSFVLVGRLIGPIAATAQHIYADRQL